MLVAVLMRDEVFLVSLSRPVTQPNRKSKGTEIEGAVSDNHDRKASTPQVFDPTLMVVVELAMRTVDDVGDAVEIVVREKGGRLGGEGSVRKKWRLIDAKRGGVFPLAVWVR
jgi:hypothetical protein